MSLYQNIRKHKLHSTVNRTDICTVAHPGTFDGQVVPLKVDMPAT